MRVSFQPDGERTGKGEKRGPAPISGTKKEIKGPRLTHSDAPGRRAGAGGLSGRNRITSVLAWRQNESQVKSKKFFGRELFL